MSYQRIGVSQLMQAEPGRTIERRSGTRAADHAEEAADGEPGHEDERQDEVHHLVIDTRATALERRAASDSRDRCRSRCGGVIQKAPGGWLIANGRMVIGGNVPPNCCPRTTVFVPETSGPSVSRALAGGDRVGGVEAALERGLRRSDRDAVRAVGREDEDLLVRVPVVPVAVVAAEGRAELLAVDRDVAAGEQDGLAVAGCSCKRRLCPCPCT